MSQMRLGRHTNESLATPVSHHQEPIKGSWIAWPKLIILEAVHFLPQRREHDALQ